MTGSPPKTDANTLTVSEINGCEPRMETNVLEKSPFNELECSGYSFVSEFSTWIPIFDVLYTA